MVNKWWECDPIVGVLLHRDARPRNIPRWPTALEHPRPITNPSTPLMPEANPRPRLIFELAKVSVELWCISDLLTHLPDEPRYQSSSQRKVERLGLIFRGEPPSLVIAVGTAAWPGDVTENGSVVVGTAIFMHDCHPNGNNPDSRWNDGPFDRVLPSSLPPNTFRKITTFASEVGDRLVASPLNPAWKARPLVGYEFAGLAAVNVTDYGEYDRTDRATLEKFASISILRNAKSIETTHGVIRAQSEAPFMFVSGITDRVGSFHDEVDPRSYSQNFVAAHNAGIVIAWMLPNIDDVI